MWTLALHRKYIAVCKNCVTLFSVLDWYIANK